MGSSSDAEADRTLLADEKPNADQPSKPDRRALIAGIAALVGGAVARVTERPAEAADGGTLLLGQTSNATLPTRLFRTDPGTKLPAFEVNAFIGGPGVVGEAGPFAASIAITATAGVAAIGDPAILAGVGNDPVKLRNVLAAAGDLGGAFVGLNIDPAPGSTILGLRGPTAAPLVVTAVSAAVQGVAFDAQSIGGLFENVAGGPALMVRDLAVIKTLQVQDLVVTGTGGATGSGGPKACGTGILPAKLRSITMPVTGLVPTDVVLISLESDPGPGVPPDPRPGLLPAVQAALTDPNALAELNAAFAPLGFTPTTAQLQTFATNPNVFSASVVQPFFDAAADAGLVPPATGRVVVSHVVPAVGAFTLTLTGVPRVNVPFKFAVFPC